MKTTRLDAIEWLLKRVAESRPTAAEVALLLQWTSICAMQYTAETSEGLIYDRIDKAAREIGAALMHCDAPDVCAYHGREDMLMLALGVAVSAAEACADIADERKARVTSEVDAIVGGRK